MRIMCIGDVVGMEGRRFLRKKLPAFKKEHGVDLVICNGENRGLASALNKALDVCRGEYVARMDLDDICYSGRFEKQISFPEAPPPVIPFPELDENEVNEILIKGNG